MTKATELSVLPSFIAANTTVVSVNATSYNIGSSFIANSTVVSANGDLKFNSGYGSAANAYGVRAWVNFNGQTFTPTVRGSGNVTSVTKLGTGNYRISFTNAMPDVNYCVLELNTYGVAYNSFEAANTGYVGVLAYNTTNGTSVDMTHVFAAIIR